MKAVIFDLDGTLTESDLEQAKKRVSEEIARLTSQPSTRVREKMDKIHHDFNVQGVYDRNVWWDEFGPLSPEEKQKLTDLYWECVIQTTKVKPNAEEVLKTLKERGIILVLLTDHDGKSFSKKKRVSLLPFISAFDLVVIAGDDTAETKPSPSPYVYILERLGLSPEEVLMVGDKPEVDLEGARALGMQTLLVEGDYGTHWDAAVRDLREILTVVEGGPKICEEKGV